MADEKHETYFGNATESILNEAVKPVKKADAKKVDEEIKEGYNRVMEKIKEIRQGYFTAVTTGSRSGSGKIVYQYFDTLKLIYRWSPSIDPLPLHLELIMRVFGI